MRIQTAPRLLALLGATFAGGLLPAQGNDIVVKKDGASLRGVEITAFTLQGITYKRGSEEGQVLAHHIADVQWGSVPEPFATGMAALKRGDFANAQNLFGEAANKAERPVVKTEAQFLAAKAAVGAAGLDKSAATAAAGALRAWLGESTGNWRVPEAMLLLGRALRLGGLADDAVTVLKDLDSRATNEGWGPIWGPRAKYEMALAQLDAGKALDARSSFQAAAGAAENALQNTSADDAELRSLKVNARVGEGETYLIEKNLDRALQFFRNLATGNDPALAAAGRVGEGETLFLKAEPQKKLDDLRAAQIALARASVLDSGGGEVSAKANFYLGKCMLALGAEREGDGFRSRANDYFQIVIRNYGDTRWAAAAKKELGK